MVMGLLSNRRPAGAPAPAAPIVNTPQALTQMRGIGTEKHLLAKRAHDDTQLKVFTRWWAAELPTSHALPEGGLAQAISDGVAGIVLLEQLTKTPFKPGSFHADPAGNRIKIIENHNTFLDRVKELGVQLTNISAEDLADGKQTLVLGLTWNLISHFSDGLGDASGGAELQSWVRDNVASIAPNAPVTSWAESFADGMALCALLNAYDSSAIPNFDSLSAANATANLELAFTVAHERFGCPRLLDAADVALDGTGGTGGGGGGDNDEKVDVKSLMTYVARLRQALRTHAEASLAAALTEVVSLESEAAVMAAWAGESEQRLDGEAAKCEQGKAAAAASAEARTLHVEAAEGAYESLITAFRSGEKATKLEERANLARRADEAKAALAATGGAPGRERAFDHGQPLQLPSEVAQEGGSVGAIAAAATARVEAMVASLDAAFASLGTSEAALEATLLSVLTYKKTDLMLAQAELGGGELAKWWGAQSAALGGVCFVAADPAAIPTSQVLAASAALESFAMEVEARAAAIDALDVTLAEVAARRDAEGREPVNIAAWRSTLTSEWQKGLAAATELRRCVGAASKWQAEQARLLGQRWDKCEAPLSKYLPEDAELTGPTKLDEAPACAVM